MINKVIKRDGRVVDFDSSKILAAVEKSMKAAGQAAPQGAAAVTEAVVRYLEAHYPDTPPKIEEIQDVVEHELMRMGFDEVATHYFFIISLKISRKSGSTGKENVSSPFSSSR